MHINRFIFDYLRVPPSIWPYSGFNNSHTTFERTIPYSCAVSLALDLTFVRGVFQNFFIFWVFEPVKVGDSAEIGHIDGLITPNLTL